MRRETGTGSRPSCEIEAREGGSASLLSHLQTPQGTQNSAVRPSFAIGSSRSRLSWRRGCDRQGAHDSRRRTTEICVPSSNM